MDIQYLLFLQGVRDAAGGILTPVMLIISHLATIGAGVWNIILAALGWYLHTIVPEEQLHDKILEYGDYIKYIIIAIVLVAALYFIVKKQIKKRSSKQ